MNKRLVWNFEVAYTQPLVFSETQSIELDMATWESRFFWPDNTPIVLNGLNDLFLELSRYQIKHRHDTYYLIPNTNYNVKVRNEQLFYKPLLYKTTGANAYGKKINLMEQKPNTTLPGLNNINVATLLELTKKTSRSIHIEKEALIYQLPSITTTKLELARFCANDQIYFSVCIESPSMVEVESITQQLLGKDVACDYITFLQSLFLLH